jgi:hypothetical protein
MWRKPPAGVVRFTVRGDHVIESSAGVYIENRVQWAGKFRTMQLASGTAPVYDVHFKPVEPLSVRFTLSITF